MKYSFGNISTQSKLLYLTAITIVMICVGNFIIDDTFTQENDYVQPRGVIATLIRTDNRSISLTINMIHSVIKFHSTKTNLFYPIIIFHEESLSFHLQQYIISCTIRHNTQINISFARVDFRTLIQPNNGSRLGKSTGYRMMCQFWTYDIFYHPAIIQGQYDYLMRMDADSYFSDRTGKDLFLYVDRQKLDYVYRATYSEPFTPMEPLLQHFLYDVTDVSDCIYNNFFIIRLKWFYESEPIQTFVNELVRDVRDGLMLREYIGDGCAHAAMLKIDRRVRVRRITDIAYGHNYHVMPRRGKLKFVDVKDFEEELKTSCRCLIVLKGTSGTLTRIPVP
ncbi:unnamed protein product [Adineta ricciae]|uniref:Uncharacterized protein n=1 Tax=Adineta ricciae TaxID=249248 RepID=A0A814TS82_ADIRI|nr:unnamed protein product [Adineta ricciae]